MANQLVALRLPPLQLDAALHRVWADGDAALPLRVDVPDEVVAPTIAALRPGAVETLTGGGTTRETLGPAPPVPDGTALVVATSGTTGEPKGVVLSHRAVTASVDASITRLGCEAGDRWLLVLPTHHVAGVQVLLRSWQLGTTAVVHDRFDPAAVATTSAEHVSLVPTQLVRLLQAGVQLSRFRTILLGGAAAERGLLTAARQAGAHVVVSYGMTETCGGCVYDGFPLGDVEVGLDTNGRIRLRGGLLGDGYRGADGTVTPLVDDDGWFATNDLGRMRSRRLEVVGRIDDMIVTGGENVPPDVVADALRSHPGVADAAVIGRPDPLWGEAVVAVVTPADPANPPGRSDLRAHVRTRHPAPYAPRHVVVVDALPRDEMGKVARDRLRVLITGRRTSADP